MNRSILIVICDFLLVSLLAFSTVDINQATDHARPPSTILSTPTNQPDAGSDLAAVMRQALEQERQQRDVLMGELNKTRSVVSERERQVQGVNQELQAKSQEATRLQEQVATAQTNLANLQGDLEKSSSQARAALAQVVADEAALRKEKEQSAALQDQLKQLERDRQSALAEKQQLSTQLQVVQAQERAASERAAQMQEQVKVEREEKARL